MDNFKIQFALLKISDNVIYHKYRKDRNKRELVSAVQGKKVIIRYFPEENGNLSVEIYGHKISTAEMLLPEIMNELGYNIAVDCGECPYIHEKYQGCKYHKLEFYK